MIIVIMGVAGAGKSTIGRLLADDLGWPFYEGDEYHPTANIEKMRTLAALTDADRGPWLAALARLISGLAAAGQSAVVACSALKRSYRTVLRGENLDVRFVYLRAGYDIIRQRLLSRNEHFMKADLLRSQFEALEEPIQAVVVDASAEPGNIVNRIRTALGR